MASDKGKLTVSEVSKIRESGVIPEGYTQEVQRDGQVYFVNPEDVTRLRAQIKDGARSEGRNPADAVAIHILDEHGHERGIPFSWVEGE